MALNNKISGIFFKQELASLASESFIDTGFVDSTNLDSDTISINGVDYNFSITTKPNFDYKVEVVNASQDILDRLNASDVEEVTTLEDYNAH